MALKCLPVFQRARKIHNIFAVIFKSYSLRQVSCKDDAEDRSYLWFDGAGMIFIFMTDPEIDSHLPKYSKLAPSLGILFSSIMAFNTREICGRLCMSAHSAPMRKIWDPPCGHPLDLCRFYGYKTKRTRKK